MSQNSKKPVRLVFVVVGYDACCSEEQSRDFFLCLESAEKFKSECEQGVHAQDEGSEDYRAPAVDGEMMYDIEKELFRG